MRGKIITAIALAVICLGISTISMASIEFEKEYYKTNVGKSIDIPVRLNYDALNTTYRDFDRGQYDNGTDWITMETTDFRAVMDNNLNTYWTVTDNYVEIVDTNGISFHSPTGFTDFDAIYCKKSAGMIIGTISGDYVYGITVMNNTFGIGSLYQIISSNNYPCNFFTGLNASARDCAYLYPLDDIPPYDVDDGLTFGQFEKMYGKIDNVSFDVFSVYGNQEMNLYEFNLFNYVPYVTDYYVVNENNQSAAWGIDVSKAGANYVFTLTVPKTEDFGSYFFVVEDSVGNVDYCTIDVVNTVSDVWVWIYPACVFVFGMGMFGIADYVADTKTNKLTVVGLVAIGVVSMTIGALMVSDLIGWTSIGFFPRV